MDSLLSATVKTWLQETCMSEIWQGACFCLLLLPWDECHRKACPLSVGLFFRKWFFFLTINWMTSKAWLNCNWLRSIIERLLLIINCVDAAHILAKLTYWSWKLAATCIGLLGIGVYTVKKYNYNQCSNIILTCNTTIR